jgi:ABC-type sulfate transport system permease subunit
MLIDVGGGAALTIFVASLFGLTFDHVRSLEWVQIVRLPILVTLVAIWLPLLFGLIWAYSLFRGKRYGWSLLVSVLTPLFSALLMAFGIALLMLPLGDGALPNPRWLQGA